MLKKDLKEGSDLGEIIKRIENILRKDFGPQDWKVKGECVEENTYWIDVDIWIEGLTFEQLNNLVIDIENELGKLGVTKDKLVFSQPPEEGIVLRFGFSLTYHKDLGMADLLDVGIIEPGQVIFGCYKGKKYEASVMPDGRIKTLHDNKTFSSPSLAAKNITATSVNGWYWWKCKESDGRELWITNLRTKYRQFLIANSNIKL